MSKFTNTKEVLANTALFDEHNEKADKEYAAQAKKLMDFDTFEKVDVQANVCDDGNSRIVRVTVTSKFTEQSIEFDSKTFFAMNLTTRDMINMDGILNEADFNNLVSMVNLQMRAGLETVRVNRLPLYSGVALRKSFKAYYDDFWLDVLHNPEEFFATYDEFMKCHPDERDNFAGIFEPKFRSCCNPCMIMTTESLMNQLGIEDKYHFVEIMKQWKQSGFLYVSGSPSSSDKCRVKYHGKWVYAVVLQNNSSGNCGNSSHSENMSDRNETNDIICLGDGGHSGNSGVIGNDADSCLK